MGAVGIPIAKTVYEHLPVIDSETWEDQDLLVGSVRRPKKAKKKTKKCTCVCAIKGPEGPEPALVHWYH